MRRLSPPVVVLTLAALTAGLGLPGREARAAGSTDPLGAVDRRLAQARETHDRAVAAVQQAERRFAELDQQYRSVQSRVEQSSADVVRAELEQRALSQQLTVAQDSLNHRAAAAYMAGPAASWELFLGSQTPAGYLSAREYAALTFSVDQSTVDQVQRSRTALAALTTRLLQREADLRSAASALQTLDGQMADQLARAQAAARQAGLTVRKLAAQQRTLERQRAEAFRQLQVLVDASRGVDQTALLALLGPTQGRGCEIPPGLKDTDTHLSGLASWYGWDLAGSPTSTGAIFDPRLFTAANKELPLNVFLRVHFQDRCAIVLVNDRGPYGLGRSFDLSQGVAQYLGYESAGVVQVTVDVLVPRTPIPAVSAP